MNRFTLSQPARRLLSLVYALALIIGLFVWAISDTPDTDGLLHASILRAREDYTRDQSAAHHLRLIAREIAQ